MSPQARELVGKKPVDLVDKIDLVVAFALWSLGCVWAGAELGRAFAPIPEPIQIVKYLPPRLQLSCSIRDRAEYTEVCKRRAESARVTANP